MKKLDSVKKPKALISLLLKWVLCASIIVFLVVAGLLIGSYFLHGKTNVTEDLITPIFKALIIILPIDLVLLFLVYTFSSSFPLLYKKNVTVKKDRALYELARTSVVVFDEDEIFKGDGCSIKEVVSIGKKNENEIIDIIGSIANLLRNGDPVINAILRYSFIPLFPDSEVVEENGYYSLCYKGQKYVLGKFDSFKYRQEEFVKNKTEPYHLKGFETMLVGVCEKELNSEKYTEFADVFGIIVIKNEVNADFKKMVEMYQNKGIKVKMISSHNPVMASEQANALGVINAGKYLSLKSTSNIDENMVNNYTVFGNLSDEQKQLVIHCLEKQGEVVSTFTNCSSSYNSNCIISQKEEKGVDVVLPKEVSPIDVIKEGVILSNKTYRAFTLILFKSLYVYLYMIMASVFTMMGYAFNYKPIILGTIFALLTCIAILFDKERDLSPSFRIMWRKIILSFGLSSLILAVIFVLYVLQYNEVVYTGLNDVEACFTMCGLVLIIGASITTINLFLPINKRRIIILSILLAIFVATTALLWGLSIHFNIPLMGISFNKLNGQNNITLAIALFMFASTYLIVNYLVDNFKERGDE